MKYPSICICFGLKGLHTPGHFVAYRTSQTWVLWGIFVCINIAYITYDIEVPRPGDPGPIPWPGCNTEAFTLFRIQGPRYVGTWALRDIPNKRLYSISEYDLQLFIGLKRLA